MADFCCIPICHSAGCKTYGFFSGNDKRVIVTWDATDEARKSAKCEGVELWKFPSLLHEISDAHRVHRTYFTDDTARTIQLFAMAAKIKTNK